MIVQLKSFTKRHANTDLALAAFAWLSVALAPGEWAAAVAAEVAPQVAPRPPMPLRLESVDFPAQQLQTAVDAWRHGCSGALGARLPDIVFEGPGVPVVVRRRADSTSHNGRCGLTTLKFAHGRLIAAEIDIFIRQENGVSCFPLTEEIAHEFGHVFALDDSPWAPRGSIMGPRLPGQRRAVSAEECAAAAAW